MRVIRCTANAELVNLLIDAQSDELMTCLAGHLDVEAQAPRCQRERQGIERTFTGDAAVIRPATGARESLPLACIDILGELVFGHQGSLLSEMISVAVN
jgi:hypothetical protein